jgi:hypothetical protein
MLMDYEVCEADHGEEGLVSCNRGPEVVVTDLSMRTRPKASTHPPDQKRRSLLPVV